MSSKIIEPYQPMPSIDGMPDITDKAWIKQRKALWPHIKQSMVSYRLIKAKYHKALRHYFMTGEWEDSLTFACIQGDLLLGLWLHPDHSSKRLQAIFDSITTGYQPSQELEPYAYEFRGSREEFFRHTGEYGWVDQNNPRLSWTDYGAYGGFERQLYRFFVPCNEYTEKKFQVENSDLKIYDGNVRDLFLFCSKFLSKNLLMLNGRRILKTNEYGYNRFQPFQYYLDDFKRSLRDEVQFDESTVEELVLVLAEYCSGQKDRMTAPDPQNLKLAKKLFGMFQQMNLHPQIDAAWKAACEQHKIPCGNLDFALPEPMQQVVLDY